MSKISMDGNARLIKALTLTTVLTLTSCGMFKSSRKLVTDESSDQPAAVDLNLGKKNKTEDVVVEEEKVASSGRPVSSKEYQRLKAQYEALLQEKAMWAKKQMADGLSDSKSMKSDHAAAVENLVNRTDKIEPVTIMEQVRDDARKKKQVRAMRDYKYSNREIQTQVNQLERAKKLLVANQLDDALTLLRKLETTGIDQVKVRAKYLTGELLFRQKEYDLAMQIFEDIIEQNAFSGLVVKVLGRLIVCTEKLNLIEKKEQYYSLLNDVFKS